MSTDIEILDQLTIPVTTDISRLVDLESADCPLTELRDAIAKVDFRTAYDFFRAVAQRLTTEGDADRAVSRIAGIDSILGEPEQSGEPTDMHLALMQVMTSIHAGCHNYDQATDIAAKALGLMAQSPKRKDEPFLSVLASLLYDIARIHYARSEFRQAERDIEKSVRIFERLVKVSPQSYESARITAVNAATIITRSRQKQIEMLAAFHETVNDSLRQVNAGADEALSGLIDSLVKEGETLVKMGRHREGIQYYSRALRYLTRIEPEFTPRQLELSVALGQTLLLSPQTREKGIHLLNTMLHKATRLRLPDEHRRIVDILVNARERTLDILGIWHKLFPR